MSASHSIPPPPPFFFFSFLLRGRGAGAACLDKTGPLASPAQPSSGACFCPSKA